MSETGHYLAVFLSNKSGPRWQEWYSLTEEARRARDETGLAALRDWDAAHGDAIVCQGGPLGPTLRVADGGIGPHVNELTVFVVVRAASHQAAAAMFVDHPHCTIFPCHAVEVMPLLGADPAA